MRATRRSGVAFDASISRKLCEAELGRAGRCVDWLFPTRRLLRFIGSLFNRVIWASMNKPTNRTEPRWLIWAREMQALAQTGLAFIQDQYDHERYQRLQSLAAEVMVEHTGAAVPDIEVMFTRQTGYATPVARRSGWRGASIWMESATTLGGMIVADD